ncbi:MAG TPA: aminoacyl-tRNA hydrolase [Candidatus Dojkabacteria bacterium]|nr:aminoacyl-tRNA hydrolase [Candidatus Dojkabacteria bacterium]
MKLITGLGNPGEKYKNTRHNAGFICIDSLYEKLSDLDEFCMTEWSRDKFSNSEIAFLKIGSEIKVILQKPQTYMNNSGSAVLELVRMYKISDLKNDFILMHDDLDIELGKIKIQMGKGPHGHNGVNDVISKLKTDEFRSVRIGIENRKNDKIDGEDFVLMNFTEDERKILNDAVADTMEQILNLALN